MQFLEIKFLILILKNHWFVPGDTNNNKSALIQVMAGHQTEAKPLPEPMMTQFSGAYMIHLTSMG